MGLVHAPEDLGAEILEPVRIQVHDPELAQRFDVDDGGDEGVGARGVVRDDVSQVVDDVGVAADVVRMLHLRVQVDRANVGAKHVDAVEVRVGAVLEHPGAAAGVADAGHRHRLARSVQDDLALFMASARTASGYSPSEQQIVLMLPMSSVRSTG